MALDDNWDERAHPNDSVSRVVSEPLKDTHNKFRPRAGVTHRREHFGVIQPSDPVRHVEINPADGDAITESRNSLVANLKFHVVT